MSKHIKIEIFGSHGSFHAHSITGVTSNLPKGEYENIVKIDIKEYEKYWKQPIPSNVDILNIGYWLKDGTYESPCNDWRKDLILNKKGKL